MYIWTKKFGFAREMAERALLLGCVLCVLAPEADSWGGVYLSQS